MMTIGEALDAMKVGARVARQGWNGRGMYLRLVRPKDPLYGPFVEMWTAQGQFVPWLCSQTDLLAEDWVRVEVSDG